MRLNSDTRVAPYADKSAADAILKDNWKSGKCVDLIDRCILSSLSLGLLIWLCIPLAYIYVLGTFLYTYQRRELRKHFYYVYS